MAGYALGGTISGYDVDIVDNISSVINELVNFTSNNSADLRFRYRPHSVSKARIGATRTTFFRKAPATHFSSRNATPQQRNIATACCADPYSKDMIAFFNLRDRL